MQVNGLPLDDDKQEERTGDNVITRIPTAAAAGFGCPCHGGQYDNEGNRTAGPPVRALDRYEFRIDNGRLLLGKTYSVSEVDGRGCRGADPCVRANRPRTTRRRPRGVALSRAAAPLMANKKKPGLLHKLLQLLLYPLNWLEERTSLPGRSGLIGGIKYFLFRKVPHDISWGHTLGSAALTAFIVQAVTGVVLAMYYVPDPDKAYESIRYITDDLTLGWLVRGMHRWGASVFIILLFLHMGRVFLYGAYKYPRELNWIIGALILVLGMLEGFFGYLLPWDQTAYWATVVGVNLQATGPFVGPFLQGVLQGGAEIGPDTLARFYSLHMLVLPGALAGLIVLHLWLVVRIGVTSPPWSPDAAGKPRPGPPPAPRAGLVAPRARGARRR